MVEVIETDSGILISLKVQPNAKKNSIIGKHGDRLKVSVTAPPEKGKANKAVIDILAKGLKVKASQIDIISGQASRDKKIHIKGISLKDLKMLNINTDFNTQSQSSIVNHKFKDGL